MNCKYCNSPLESQAHFCAKCGAQLTEDTIVSGNNQVTATEPLPIEASTAFSAQEPMPAATNPQPLSQQPMPLAASPQSFSQEPMPFAASPQSLSQQGYIPQDQHRTPTTPLTRNGQQKQRKRRGGPGPGGCFLILLTVLVLIFGSLGGVWFLVLRPQIHQMVLDKLDSSMGQAVDQIPPLNQILPPPPPIPIPVPSKQLPPITEGLLNNVMRLTLSPSSQLKDPQFHITEQNVSMDFSVQPDFLPFSIPCTVSFVPTVDDQGNVVVTQVNVQGLATLIISGDDITPIINRHLHDAMTRLNNPVSSIQLQQGAMIITLR